MAVLTSNPMESLLCLLVEAFLPLELTKTLRPAEHQVTGTGCTTFASGSLGGPLVIVSGATPISGPVNPGRGRRSAIYWTLIQSMYRLLEILAPVPQGIAT